MSKSNLMVLENKSRAVTILTAMVIGGLALATGLSFFARQWWVFELTSHFRVQYFLVLFVCSCVCVFRAHYRWALTAGIVALINLAIFAPFERVVHANTSAEKPYSRNYRAVLVNVSYDNDDYAQLVDYIRLINPDLLLLLEVNDVWMSKLKGIQDTFPYLKGHVHKKYGIVLMSQIPIKQSSILFFGEEDIPTVVATIVTQDKTLFTLLGTHPRSPVSAVHAHSRNEQLSKIATLVSQRTNPVVLLGDLNVTPWSPVFWDFLAHSGLHDSQKGIGYQPTWPTMFPFAWIPIDHCLISSEVYVSNRQVGPNIGSDHYPLVVDLSIRSGDNTG